MDIGMIAALASVGVFIVCLVVTIFYDPEGDL